MAGPVPQRVLETAAGTGVLTRHLVAQLPSTAQIVATDLNEPMLAVAAAKVDDARVDWRQADALALPLPDNTFDAVACQFGAMFFPDKFAGYREVFRVLVPGGRFHVNVWDRIEANDFANVVTGAMAELFPANPPTFMARIPHGYYGVALIESHLRDAGFGSVSVESVDAVSRAESARDAAIAYCQGSPLRNHLDPARLADATDATTAAIAARFGEGPVEGRTRAHVFTAER